MKCPVCNLDMNMAERQGVEIDYCPQCRGIWLDRGELDKIIERSLAPNPSRLERPLDVSYSDRHSKDHDDDHYRYPQHKKKGFLKDMFDF